MTCVTCGHDGPTTMDGHACPPTAAVAAPEARRLPWYWETATWLVFAAVCAWILNSLLSIGFLLVFGWWLITGLIVPPATADLVISAGRFIDVAHLVLFSAGLAGLVGWRRWSRSVLAERGAFAPESALAHWSLRAATITAIGTWVIGFFVGLTGIGSLADRGSLAVLVLIALRLLRVLTGAFVIVAVLVMRKQSRDAVAATDAQRPNTGFWIPPAPQAGTPMSPTNAAGLDIAGLPIADDAYWGEVTRLLVGTGTDLPLLESWSARSRHWRLLSAGFPEQSVAAARHQVRRGAVITVYPRSPQPTGAGSAPAADDGTAFGLIEDTATGALGFRRLSPFAVAPWVAEAHTGQRLGLYPENPADLPGSLTAIVPAT